MFENLTASAVNPLGDRPPYSPRGKTRRICSGRPRAELVQQIERNRDVEGVHRYAAAAAAVLKTFQPSRAAAS